MNASSTPEHRQATCRTTFPNLRVPRLGPALRGAALLAVAARLAGAQPALVALPLDDPAYVQLQGLERQGCRDARISAHRPYLVGAVRTAVGRAATSPRCSGVLLEALRARFALDSVPDQPADSILGAATDRAAVPADAERLYVGGAVRVVGTALGEGEFRPLWRDIRDPAQGDPPVRATARGRVTWGGPRLAAVAEGLAQTHRRNDPRVRQRALRNTSGFVDFGEAYVSGQLGPVVLSLGRMPEAWLGAGEESLVLSAHGPPLDRLVVAAQWRRVEARALVATLDDVQLTEQRDSLPAGSPPRRFHRLLVGHVLTVRPTPALELTFGETALLSRGTRTFDLAYANPMMLYVVTQNDSSRVGADQDDNLTLFGALRARLGPATVSAELLVDDIQIDAADRERTPDQLGGWLRVSTPLPLVLPTSVGLEYRRVGSYTYLRHVYAGAYQHYDQPLGSELGPDADLVRLDAELWAGPWLRLAGGLGLWRRGGLRIDQRPGPDLNGHAGEPFPSVSAARPAVQRALLGDATLQWLRLPLPITARVELARAEHPNNQLAPTALYVRAQLAATYAIRLP